MDFSIVPLFCLAVLGAGDTLAASARIECETEVTQAVLAPDGRNLFAVLKNGSGQDLVALDTASKSRVTIAKGPAFLLIKRSAGEPRSLLSPDGKSLLGFVGEKTKKSYKVSVCTWDVSSKLRTALFDLDGTSFPVLTGAFSPDGNVLAVPDCNTKKVRLWKREASAKWRPLKVLEVGREADAKTPNVLNVAFTPSGKHVFTSFLLTRKVVSPWLVHEDISMAIGLEKWDLSSGRKVPFPVTPIEITPPGFCIFVASILSGVNTLCIQTEQGVVGIDATSGKKKYVTEKFGLLSLSPDSQTGAFIRCSIMGRPSEPAEVGFWNFSDGTKSRRLTVPDATGSFDKSFRVFSADSRYFVLADGGDDRRIHVIDAKTANVQSC